MIKTLDEAIEAQLVKKGWYPNDKLYPIMRHRLESIAATFDKRGRPWRVGETWDEYARALFEQFGPEE